MRDLAQASAIEMIDMRMRNYAIVDGRKVPRQQAGCHASFRHGQPFDKDRVGQDCRSEKID